MKISARGVSVCVVAAVLAAGLTARAGQEKPLDKRVADIEAGQKEILKELQEIKALLQARGATPPAPQGAVNPPAALPAFDLDVAGAPVKGASGAKLVIVEFSDFQCPFCGRYIRETFSQLEHEYVDSGKVRYVFRHFPLERLHPRALRASEAADCAHQQGKFWPMHDQLFTNQQALGETDLVQHAQRIGLSAATFQQCMVSEMNSPARIRQDQTEGARAGITGTPTFFIGTMKDGKVHVLRKLVGAQPYAAFKTTLDTILGLPEFQ